MFVVTDDSQLVIFEASTVEVAIDHAKERTTRSNEPHSVYMLLCVEGRVFQRIQLVRFK